MFGCRLVRALFGVRSCRSLAPVASIGDATIVAELAGQTYPSSAPTAANMAILPNRVRDAYNQILMRKNAELPPGQLVRLTDAVVFGNGSVMTRDGTVISETFAGDRQQLPDALRITRRLKGPMALLRKAGDSNYGHWLLELLPRVTDFRRELPDVPLRFGIANGPVEMRGVRRDTLRWLQIEDADVLLLTADPVVVDELFLISSNSIHSHTHDAAGAQGISELARSLVPSSISSRRIFVRREPSSRRRLVGEEQIFEIAREAGFEGVFPETLSVDAQVAVFRDASAVAGVTGAPLTNLLWAPGGCKVCILSPNLGQEFFFWDVANIRGQLVTFIFGKTVGAPAGIHSDFEVDPALVSSWIASLASN